MKKKKMATTAMKTAISVTKCVDVLREFYWELVFIANFYVSIALEGEENKTVFYLCIFKKNSFEMSLNLPVSGLWSFSSAMTST